MAGSCQLGGRFRKCVAVSIETCQYCGRGMCEVHLYFREAYEAVCIGDRCKAKHHDMQSHLKYRARVSERNRAGLCGVEECGPHPQLVCSLCQGQFCYGHIQERMYPMREGRVVIEKPASICPQCWSRRKIWRA